MVHVSRVLSTLALAAMTATASQAQRYTLVDLGTLPGHTVSIPFDINNSGQIVGVSIRRIDGIDESEQAFLYANGVMQGLGALPDDTYSLANALNDSGLVVGVSFNNQPLQYRAFAFEDGVMRDLGSLPGWSPDPRSVNQKGEIAGILFDATGGTHAFLFHEGLFTDLGTLGGPHSGAFGINKAGNVVGFSTLPSGFHAFIYDGAMQDLGAFGDSNGSEAYSINNEGQIVGYSYLNIASSFYHAFLYSNGTFRDLGTLGGNYSKASDINKFGVIVGHATIADGQIHGFVYDSSSGTMANLNDLVQDSDGWAIFDAAAVNDRGQIVASAKKEGVTHAFLLTPVARGH